MLSVLRVLLPAFAAIAIGGCKTASGALPGWNEGSGQQADMAAADDEQSPEADDEQPGPDGERATAEPSDQGAPEQVLAQTDDGGESSADAPAQRRKKPEPLPPPLHDGTNSACGKDPGVGQRLKSFALQTPKGEKISHKTYRGRVLLVNFWGTWCKPCLKELPEFDQLYRRYRKHGLTLLAIATDEDAAPVRDFKRKRRLAARMAIGGESYANQYGSDRFPFTFIVDPKGVIKASYRGYKPECIGQLEADLRAELKRRNH